jgi:hypothetical protein
VFTQTSIGCIFRRTITGTVTVCLLGMTLPPARPGHAYAQTDTRARAAAEPGPTAPTVHFLRDAIPATAFAAEPPDTIDEDDFVLPEEKDKKQLAKEIAIFVLAAAFVAFFIVKVFIEEDDEGDDDDDGGKVVPPPQ